MVVKEKAEVREDQEEEGEVEEDDKARGGIRLSHLFSQSSTCS